MLTKRIIPCLDIKNGRVVKGVQFAELRDAGDPLEAALRYVDEGADELVFLDISASEERRSTLLELVRSLGRVLTIPFTVGGGIGTLADAERLLSAGADKVSVNTAAVQHPELIPAISEAFGAQALVVAIDTEQLDGQDWVMIYGGSQRSTWHTLAWAQKAEALGAGELLLTSKNADGSKAGFDLRITAEVSGAVSIPVIASGGAGNARHFVEVFRTARADAALAASIFHFKQLSIPELKADLHRQGIPVRLF
jgi:cyclase